MKRKLSTAEGNPHRDQPFSISPDAAEASSSRWPARSIMEGVTDTGYQPPPQPVFGDPAFDILEWHPAYQSCQRYFLDHAQHDPATQALCALINIRLPFQYLHDPITSAATQDGDAAPAAVGSSSTASSYSFNLPRPGGGSMSSPNRARHSSIQTAPRFISLIPYIRRLVVTGFDKPAILHGFFGDDYARGVLAHLDCERRNYLFAAKHGGWRSCKKQYDNGSGLGGGDESVPFMKPLDEPKMEELTAAEKAWSQWLAMEDWMIGPRAPGDSVESSQVHSDSRVEQQQNGAHSPFAER